MPSDNVNEALSEIDQLAEGAQVMISQDPPNVTDASDKLSSIRVRVNVIRALLGLPD